MKTIFKSLMNFLAVLLMAVSANAQTFSILYTFQKGSDGASPDAGLLLVGTNLYGMTKSGGSSKGTIFKISTNGMGYTSFAFTAPSGGQPQGGLISSGSELFGTERNAGTNLNGGVFSISVNLTGFTNLVILQATNGQNPVCILTLSGSTLYGTTPVNGPTSDYGCIFAVGTNGTGFTNIFNFPVTKIDGGDPVGGLVLSDGILYGTTTNNFNGNSGNVFAITTNGANFTSLHNFAAGSQLVIGTNSYFTNSDGTAPQGALVLAGGRLFGAAEYGGINGMGALFAVNTNGNDFTNLYNFSTVGGTAFTNSDGANPVGGLLLAGGWLYGTTVNGGRGGEGTVFAINTNGTGFTNLYSFTATSSGVNSDGANPHGALIIAGDVLYGTTENGGHGGGGVFSLTVPPVPIPLNVQLSGGNAVLSWNDPLGVFSLYATPSLTTAFTNVPGATSPYTNDITVMQEFYRLQSN